MLYCEKCRSVCQDSTAKCPGCRSSRLRPAGGEDMVLLHRADQYTAQRLCRRFDEESIPWETEPFGKGRASYLYDSEVLPTDKNIFVRYADLEKAEQLSAQLKEALEQEQAGEEGEEFEDMPRKKRIVVQVLSVLAFLALVMLTVFGADALAGWLKGIFGM